MVEEAKWYAIHTYSGYENKVKANIEKMIGNRKLNEQIQEVIVPMHHVLETKNGIKKDVEKKLFPGYVLVKMCMNDETWYIIRNTRGVTGFVGPDGKPVPLTEQEIHSMGIDLTVVEFNIKEGDTISVLSGPFEGYVGVVHEINEHKHTVIVNLSIFGRETPVELEYEKINVM